MDPDFSCIEVASIPKELAGPLPRKVRLSANGTGMAVAAGILLVLTVVFAFWSGFDRVQKLQSRAMLRHDGEDSVAEITRLWSAGHSLKTRVRYKFAVNGVPFTGEALVPRDLVSGLSNSDTLPIRYVPANPSINHPAAWESVSVDWNSLGGAIIGIALSLFLYATLRSERRLVAEGAPAVGEITRCAPGRKGGFSLNYDFRAQDGTIAKGSGWSGCHREVGERVCVLYLPRNPRRNLSYPSLNYRIAN